MTNLWRCLLCDRETLSNLPLCIHCGPDSRGKMEPARPNWNSSEPPAAPREPRRDPSAILATYRTNLEWAIDCATLKLNRLKPGSSAFKTQSGLVRGLQEALGGLKSEMGS